MHLLSTRFLLILTGIFFFLPQAASAAYTIADQDSGNDCAEIGTWNESSKTCTLSGTVHEGIVLADGVTLDGDGNTLEGNGEGYGITSKGKDHISIQNVTIKNFSEGVYIQRIDNANISNVTIEDTHSGIIVGYSNDIEITDFTVEGSTTGINISESDAVSLMDGKVIKSKGYGLYIKEATHLTLSGNAFSSDADSDNASNLFFLGSIDNPETYDSHTIDDTNTFDGKTFYYLVGASDTTVGKETGAIMCIDCKNVSVKNATFLPSDTPAFFLHSQNILVQNSTFSEGLQAVHLIDTTNATITKNTFQEKLDTGVFAQQGSDALAIEENTFSDLSTAVSVKDSSGVSATNNTLSGVLIGFNFKNAPNATITNNTADEGIDSYGVMLSGSPDSLVSRNVFPRTASKSIEIENSDRVTVSKNTITGGYGKTGIWVEGSDGTTLSENSISASKSFSLSEFTNGSVEKNKMVEDGGNIYLSHASGNRFSENTVSGSFFLTESTHNTFVHNNFLSPEKDVTFANDSTGNIFSTQEEHGNYPQKGKPLV